MEKPKRKLGIEPKPSSGVRLGGSFGLRGRMILMFTDLTLDPLKLIEICGYRFKIEAYHRFVQLGCIAQGLLQHLSLNDGNEVRMQFRCWLRIMNPNNPPSELVVSYALRSSLFDFLKNSSHDENLRKIITENMTVEHLQEYWIDA